MNHHHEHLKRLAMLRAETASTEQGHAAPMAAPLSASARRGDAQIVGDFRRAARKRVRPGLTILFGLATVAAGPCLAMGHSADALPGASTPAPAAATPRSRATTAPVALTRDQAFRIVYPGGTTFVKVDDEAINVLFSPIALFRLDASTLVLVSGGQNLDENCHGCAGFFSVAYLGASPSWTVEGTPYVGRGQTGGWGTPPGITIIRSLSSEPMIFVRSGQSGQGSTESWGQLVRLGAAVDDVSIALDRFDVSYDNDGSAADCSIRGRIIPGKRDQSFRIRYTGTYRGDVLYTSSGGAYTPVGGPPRDLWKRCPGMGDEE